MNNQTIEEKCEQLKLLGVAEAFKVQNEHPEYDEMEFNSRLGELLDAQVETNSQRRIKTLTTQAKLRFPNVFMQDIDYRLYPNLKKHKLTRLAECDWISKHQNVSITGPTGTGKTTLACILAQEAIYRHIPVRFYRISKFLLKLLAAKNDGDTRFLNQVTKVSLLILDDWGNALMSPPECQLFMDLIEERDGKGSLLITSQYSTDIWHESFNNVNAADSVIDRIIPNTHKINLGDAESIRKLKGLELGGEDD
jgi:DNA replication protein DnaC